MKKLLILLADDHDVVRTGLRLMIEKVPEWVVCGEAATGREAVRLAELFQPDIVVLDMKMPDINGLEATRQIRRRFPETEVLLFTGSTDEELMRSAFEAGARGYLSKMDAVGHFISALEALSVHRPYFTPEVAEIVFQRIAAGADDGDGVARVG
jgi:DNA-binding NarL/FixJ family response regulator